MNLKLSFEALGLDFTAQVYYRPDSFIVRYLNGDVGQIDFISLRVGQCDASFLLEADRDTFNTIYDAAMEAAQEEAVASQVEAAEARRDFLREERALCHCS